MSAFTILAIVGIAAILAAFALPPHWEKALNEGGGVSVGGQTYTTREDLERVANELADAKPEKPAFNAPSAEAAMAAVIQRTDELGAQVVTLTAERDDARKFADDLRRKADDFEAKEDDRKREIDSLAEKARTAESERDQARAQVSRLEKQIESLEGQVANRAPSARQADLETVVKVLLPADRAKLDRLAIDQLRSAAAFLEVPNTGAMTKEALIEAIVVKAKER